MKIAVCVKQVPDTAAIIQVDPRSGRIPWDEIQFIVNPYDEYAVEEAVRIKESVGGEVIAVGLGAEHVEQSLRKCLAVGVDSEVACVSI